MDRQNEALAQFKERVQDILRKDPDNYYHQDCYLRKWLVARNWDVGKAEKMFKDSTEYKEKMGIKDILTTYQPPENMLRYVTGGGCGRDREGRHVQIHMYGNMDVKGMVYAFRREDLEKFKMWDSEVMLQENRRASEELGRRVDGFCVIVDLKGMNRSVFWRPGLVLYLHMIKTMEDNYPDSLHKLFFINAPAIFPILYKLARPLISEDTRRKINVLGKNHMTTIRKYISDDQVPAFIGGTLTDPDGNPECRTLVRHGGKIPTSLYLCDQMKHENLTQASIQAGSKLCLNFLVTEPGSILQWEFKTEENDIGFGILYEKEKMKLEPVVESSRLNSHQVPVDDSLDCKQLGKYIVVFDNSFSWTKAKKVFYHIEVQTADVEVKNEIQNMTVENDTS